MFVGNRGSLTAAAGPRLPDEPWTRDTSSSPTYDDERNTRTEEDTLIGTVWERFRGLLEPNDLARIRPPADNALITAAELRLGVALPAELRALYTLADGFDDDAFLLRDDYRILPVTEMVDRCLARARTRVVTDALAGESEAPKKSLARLVFARAKPESVDVDDVALRLRKRGATVEITYREGGIHDFAEAVDIRQSLATWLGECLEYY